MECGAILLVGLLFGGFLVHQYNKSKNKKHGGGVGVGGKGEPGNSVEK